MQPDVLDVYCFHVFISKQSNLRSSLWAYGKNIRKKSDLKYKEANLKREAFLSFFLSSFHLQE